MIKCRECNDEALYDSPRDLCLYHWLLWWNEGDLEQTEKDFITLLKYPDKKLYKTIGFETKEIIIGKKDE